MGVGRKDGPVIASGSEAIQKAPRRNRIASPARSLSRATVQTGDTPLQIGFKWETSVTLPTGDICLFEISVEKAPSGALPATPDGSDPLKSYPLFVT